MVDKAVYEAAKDLLTTYHRTDSTVDEFKECSRKLHGLTGRSCFNPDSVYPYVFSIDKAKNAAECLVTAYELTL